MLHHPHLAISCITGETVENILFDELQGKSVIVYEYNKLGTTTKRFKAQGACTGEEIENCCVDDSRAEYIEQSLSSPVRGGADALLLHGRREQFTAFCRSTNNSHEICNVVKIVIR